MQRHPTTTAPATGASALVRIADAGKLLQAVTDVVCALDEQGVFCYLNDASTQLLGYRPEELVGSALWSYIPADDAVTMRRGLLPANPVAPLDVHWLHPDGRPVALHWESRWDEGDQLFYCTARKAAPASEVEQRLNKAQQIARVANYEFDIAAHCYTYASDTLFDIFGIDRRQHPQFTSELFWSRIHPDDRELVLENVLQYGPPYAPALEYRIVHPDGRVVHILRLREVVCDAQGHPVKTIGTLQDITDRKLVELERARSEERLRSLVENGNDIIGIIDAAGICLFMGTNIEAHTGYKAGELEGRSVLHFIHPEDIATVRKAMEDVVHQKILTVGPLRFRNKAGEWHWIETTVSNHLGNPLIGGLVTNSRDITIQKEQDDERRLFQERIEEQNQMMVEVLEQMSDGFVTIADDDRVIYWNGEAERITGIPRERAMGHSFWSLYPGMKQSPYYTIYRHLLDSREPLQQTVLSPFTAKWFELRAYRTGNGLSVFFRDVTQRKAAEEELQRLSLIARETTNPVIIQDSQQRVQWVNNAFLKLSGYSEAECIGRTIGEICDGPQTSPETIRYVQQQVARREPYHVETLNYKKNGDTYWSEVSCQPVLNDKGEVVQYFSIATDITERKRLERQLEREQRERQNKIAAATFRAQEHERSVVSQELHDGVNQVLTTVKLYTEMVRDGVVDSTEVLNKSVALLQDSINEIRSLSKRLSAPSLGKIGLAESVKELIDAVTATRKFVISLTTSARPHPDVSQEVHLAVYRILQEHLTNVLKHAGASRVIVALQFTDTQVHLCVSDDGIGFDPSRKHNGIGIANMITRAESLGGCLTLQSAPGKGCELAASIPI